MEPANTAGATAAARPAALLRLRPPREGDEAAFLAAHKTLAAEGFTFGLHYQPGMTWREYLAALAGVRAGTNVPAGMVPGAFLVADVAGELVGRASVRFALNDFLSREGGHIGYCVLPRHRRRGYATEILRQSLVTARAAGVDRVLVTCDDSNIGSRTVIESCGGRLDSVISAAEDGRLIRRYWIE
jgi:predicted acetyltransferase